MSEAEPGAGPGPWLTLSGGGGRGGAGGRVRDSCLVDIYWSFCKQFIVLQVVVVLNNFERTFCDFK